jgi:hypothetical protein
LFTYQAFFTLGAVLHPNVKELTMMKPILACMAMCLVAGCMVDRDGDGRRDFGWRHTDDHLRRVDTRLPVADAPAYQEAYWYDSIHRGSGGFWQTRASDASRDMR